MNKHLCSLMMVSCISAAMVTLSQAAGLTESVETDEGKLSFSMSAAYFDMDVANGLGTAIDDGPFNFLRQAENGANISDIGVKGAVEFWKPAELPYLGTGYFFGGVKGAYVEGDSDSMGTLVPGDFLDVLPIDGTNSAGSILSGGGTDFFVSSDMEFWRIGAYVGAGRDMSGVEGKIGLGLYGAVSRLELDSSVQDQNGVNFIRLSEEVDTYSIGPMITAERRFALANGMSLSIGGKLAVLYAHGDLDAAQSSTFLGAPIFVSDTENDLAFVGELNAGLELFSNGRTTISLIGAVEWRNDVYSVANPRAAPGDVTNSAAFNPGPTRLDQTDQFSASLGLKAIIRF